MSHNQRFEVRFWGVRGTVPCPGPATLRYGGNTSCVEVRLGSERLILDAGTGIRELGVTLKTATELRSHILLSHTHLDHINGLPFFKPAYDESNHFELWAGHLQSRGHRLQEVLATLMQKPFFPVPMEILHACIAFHDFEAGDLLEPFPGLRVRTCALNHPGGATGYRIEFDGRSLCYVTDTEHRGRERDPAILDLIQGSGLVIYDAHYTQAEYERNYRGWGHSTWQEGVRLCEAAGAGRLVLFHHCPDHSDEIMDRIALDLERARPGSLIAREGMVLTP